MVFLVMTFQSGRQLSDFFGICCLHPQGRSEPLLEMGRLFERWIIQHVINPIAYDRTATTEDGAVRITENYASLHEGFISTGCHPVTKTVYLGVLGYDAELMGELFPVLKNILPSL